MKKLFYLVLVTAIACSSCNYMMGKRVRGNGHINTEEHNASSFKDVQVSGAIDLYVSQGEIKPVKIETDENLQQYIEVKDEGDRLIIKFRQGYNPHPTEKIKAYVTAPVFRNIEVSGASNIATQSKISNTDDLHLGVSGAGDINMDIDAPSINAEISGSGEVNLKGATKSFSVGLSGAGKAHCYELLSEETRVEISGAGDAEVYASQKLSAEVSGAGTVMYKGGASNVQQQVSGAGSVKKAE